MARSVPESMRIPAKRPKRVVSFMPFVTVQPVERFTSTREDKLRLYYSTDELDAFSVEAKASRTLTKDIPSPSTACSARVTKRDCLVGLNADPALRGLELYLCPIRVRNKLLAEKSFLKYHEKLSGDLTKTDDEKLACLAEASGVLGRWARMVAIETARLDSIRAYDDRDYPIPTSKMALTIEPFPATSIPTKRRRLVDGDSRGRSKRRTLEVIE